MDVCKTDLAQAARLLREAAAYITVNAKTAREADKARQMQKLSKKLTKKIDNGTTLSPRHQRERPLAVPL